MDSFLASVEKQALVMAKMAVHDTDKAQDIVQDTMFQMVKKYVGKPDDQWPSLFFRILNNRIVDQYRKRGLFDRMTQWFGYQTNDEVSPPDAVDQLPSKTLEPDSQFQISEIGDKLRQSVELLPLRQQQAVILRLWLGLSVQEAAIAMKVSDGSVKTHLHRALQTLRTHLSEYQ
ncbi:MAG: sigma-70 family RNA polymerase sigma factor [Gammaproteobacteria bacterium]|nr:sigma-70 family RNA polymerase sigma factor [Gammaproteobacteria bacterium]